MKIKNNPKNIKYGRVFRLKLKKNKFNSTGYNIPIYRYGLMSLENGKLVIEHFNAISRFLRKRYKKEVKTKFNISLIIPVTSKPLEARLGGGKGQRKYWECPIRRGMILMEFTTNIEFYILKRGLRIVQDKLPFLTKIVRIIY